MVVAAGPPRKSNPAKAVKAAPTQPAPALQDAASPIYESALPAIFAQRFNRVLDDAGYPPTISRRCTNVAYDFEVSAAAVRKWLLGEGLPSPAMMKRLAQHFAISLDFLLGLSEQRSL